MEDQKKKMPPRKEGGHKEGGQRISVRPGNFAPPTERNAESEPAEHTERSGERANPEQNRNRHGRNRHGRNRNRDRRENQNPNAEQQPRTTERPAAGAQQNNRKPDEGKGRHNGGKAPAERRPSDAQLSETLKRELDAEFDSSAFASFSPLRNAEKATELSAADTAEFEVDIATANYLLEDVPCGFPAPDGKSVEVIGVRFRQAGKVYFFAPGKEKFRIGEAAIVDTARGAELGEVVILNRKIAEKDVIQPLRPVLRRATEEDIAHHAENRAKEREALKICAGKILQHKLDMKLVEAQYTFDNTKLLFYFTSDGRVDFRELVRDLAGVFRTRIELRQIGIRDESRLIGGLGMCGRPFCCTTFLSDFGQVSVKMAKEQGLSINTSKISGCCGRLMCCLRYEHETYAAEAALTPQKDARVITPDGPGTVTESTPLAGTVKVRLDKCPEEPPTVYHRSKLTSESKTAEASPDTAESTEG